MSVVSTYRKDNQILEIFVDEDPTSPREWDNLGTIIAYHPDYILGDKQMDLQTAQNECKKHIKTAYVALPLYMLEHSGTWLSTETFVSDPQGWDTSAVGMIYCTKSEAKKMLQVDTLKSSDKKRVEQILKEEVEECGEYLNGDVYGYSLSTVSKCNQGMEHLHLVDSCGGYYGQEGIDSILVQNGAQDWEKI